MSAEDFDSWGWRIPFLISIVLLGISVWIRLMLNESPAFKRMKEEGKASKAPLTESFGQWKNLKVVLLALFGLVAGQAVVWYTGQFYALFFLTQTLKVDAQAANLMIAAALLLGTPFFVIFGMLSDRIGRKPIIMAGLLLACLTYFPLFKGITHFANPALEQAVATSPVVVVADPNECSFQFNPVGTSQFTTSCDIAKSALVKRGIPYTNEAAPAGTIAQIKVGSTVIPSYSATPATNTTVNLGHGPSAAAAPTDAKAAGAAFEKGVGDALKTAGYPAKADPASINYTMTVLLLTVLVIYVTLVYAPIAAMLVEMFPTRIRYTSMSLPYHIGNGWFGGFLPTTSFAIVAATGDIYSGLWYPIVIAAATLVIGMLFIRETKDLDIHHHD